MKPNQSRSSYYTQLLNQKTNSLLMYTHNWITLFNPLLISEHVRKLILFWLLGSLAFRFKSEQWLPISLLPAHSTGQQERLRTFESDVKAVAFNKMVFPKIITTFTSLDSWTGPSWCLHLLLRNKFLPAIFPQASFYLLQRIYSYSLKF